MVEVSAEHRSIVVLLVDDQRFVGAAVSRLVSGEPDISLHCCHDPAEAVAQANALRPTVILQDLVMPGIDGLALVALFRCNPSTSTTPIVVLSASENAETRARALASGADDYLLKLPAKAELIECIRRYGSHERAGSEPTLDPDEIATLHDAGDPAFVLMLIDQFVEDADASAILLREAARCGDGSTLRSVAHRLKGSSLILGARRLAAVCGQIEDRFTKAPDAAVDAAQLAALDQELVQVRAACAAERRSIGAPDSLRQ